MKSSPQQVLKEYWGYSTFRPLQEEIINHVLAGSDTLALLPTGGGKSICFQVPALVNEGVTIVISPLIALMKDQVRQLRERNIIADAIYSGMRSSDIDRILDNAVYGNTKLLYMSPERISTELAKERIRRMNVSMIAVDEAHCISQWGYDFRPAYLKISDLRDLQPNAPIIAVTATATPEVVEDIQKNLGFRKGAKAFKQSFARDNLSYVIRPSVAKETEMLKVLKGVPGSSVVYVRSRRGTRLIAQQLQRRGIAAAAYHAGLDAQEKDDRQSAWIQGDLRVIVATNAFGMGIDKPDVRSVIHYDLPDSPEAYFQEAGRGGRDGKASYAVLLYQREDVERLKSFLALSFPEVSEIRRVYRAIGSYLQLATGGGKGESFDFNLSDFCASFGFDPGPTYHCLRALEKHGYLLMTDALHQPATIKFILSKEQLYDYQLKHPKSVKLIKSILRTSQGAFLEPVKIREGNLANFLNLSLQQLQATFRKMAGEGIIDYQPTKDSPQLVFLTERLDADNLAFNLKEMNFLKSRAEHRVETMANYATLPDCRSKLLLAYFGEKDAAPCGKCDWCLTKLKASKQPEPLDAKKALDIILDRLAEKNSLLPAEVYQLFPEYDKSSLQEALQFWISEGILRRDGLQIRKP